MQPDDLPDLQRRARELRASYEVRPEQWWGGPPRRLQHVGFVIELSGRHAHDARCRPGCHRCQHTYRQFLDLALAVLPLDDGASRFDIEPFDGAWHGVAGPAHAVVVRIHVLHRDDASRGVDEGQRQVSDAVCAALRALGVKDHKRNHAA